MAYTVFHLAQLQLILIWEGTLFFNLKKIYETGTCLVVRLFVLFVQSQESRWMNSQKGVTADQRCSGWEPEGRYCHWLCTAIAPFWFSTEHLWAAIMPFWLSTDNLIYTQSVLNKFLIGKLSNNKLKWYKNEYWWCKNHIPSLKCPFISECRKSEWNISLYWAKSFQDSD